MHGQKVYWDDENDYNTQLQRLIQLQRLAQQEMSRGRLPPAVKFHDFLNAMAGAKANKQSGSDGVVVEMIRNRSWQEKRPEVWREITLVAIPKKTDKVGFRAMRFISLLPVLQKFYVRALQAAVRREHRPHQCNILSFEPRRSTAGVTGTL